MGKTQSQLRNLILRTVRFESAHFRYWITTILPLQKAERRGKWHSLVETFEANINTTNVNTGKSLNVKVLWTNAVCSFFYFSSNSVNHYISSCFNHRIEELRILHGDGSSTVLLSYFSLYISFPDTTFKIKSGVVENVVIFLSAVSFESSVKCLWASVCVEGVSDVIGSNILFSSSYSPHLPIVVVVVFY